MTNSRQNPSTNETTDTSANNTNTTLIKAAKIGTGLAFLYQGAKHGAKSGLAFGVAHLLKKTDISTQFDKLDHTISLFSKITGAKQSSAWNSIHPAARDLINMHSFKPFISNSRSAGYKSLAISGISFFCSYQAFNSLRENEHKHPISTPIQNKP
jgi:hypothetical protein